MQNKREMLVKYRDWRTQNEMGERYGVSQQLWNCWEQGKSAPGISIIKRLERDSGISMEKLFPDLFPAGC